MTLIGWRSPLTTWAGLAFAVLGLGSLLGVIWWSLAPVVRLVKVDDRLFSPPGQQELAIAQDGWFAVIYVMVAVIVAIAATVTLSQRPAAGTVVGILGLLALSMVSSIVGSWLGPDPISDQMSAGELAPLTPLRVHTFAVFFLAPIVFCLTRCFASLLIPQSPTLKMTT
ncbi:MAG: hypothetical protein ACRCTR_01775 [Actinomycetota bacterium]